MGQDPNIVYHYLLPITEQGGIACNPKGGRNVVTSYIETVNCPACINVLRKIRPRMMELLERESMTATNPTPEQLASEFSRILNEWLTPEQITEINRRNALPEYKGLCASHEFCDPNQAMIDALGVFGIEFDPDTSTELIDSAWTIAKDRGFTKR